MSVNSDTLQIAHDTIASRLTQIIRRFHNGETLYRDELAEEFNVHEKTIRKDMNERLSFLPIIHNKGVYTIDKIALGNLDYSDIKSFAKLSGLIGLYPDLDADLIVDLLNVKVNSIYKIKNQGYNTPNRVAFELISAAILKQEQISLRYNDKSRILNPYKLLNNRGIWYLVASEDNKIKHYTLSKIQDCRLLENQFFMIDTALKEQIEADDRQWTSGEPIEVTLQIDTKSWDYFSRKDTVSNYKIIKQTDEFITITTNISFDDEILGLVKSYIPYIQILSLSNIKDKLKLQLKDYLKTFSKN